MAERFICSQLKGSFNTDVYSFGKYLHVKKPMDNVLTKEGSAMALKNILSGVQLKCFKAGGINLAPALFDLIIQLKSAKVTPEDLLVASNKSKGLLKDKLEDISSVFSAYENFITQNNYEDQNSILSYLPQVIKEAEDVKGTDVILLGYTGFTEQMRAIVSAFIDTAKSVTAILTESNENEFVFVNETANFIRKYCKENGVPLLNKDCPSNYNVVGENIVKGLFNPFYKNQKGLIDSESEQVYYSEFESPFKEIESVGEVIKRAVLDGKMRYRDVTIAVPNTSAYGGVIESVFHALDIPYYLDEQKRADSHPLVTLILSYVDAFRKNLERGALTNFFKNPLFCKDKAFADEFESYLLKNNINYGAIKKPFVSDKTSVDHFEEFRVKILKHFEKFDVDKLLEDIGVEQSLEEFSLLLKQSGNEEQSAVNDRIYGAVTSILEQMKNMLDISKLSPIEYKNVFLSGISALTLTIIPQYNDAVFVGSYKQTALAKAKYLFAVGLTSSVPDAKEDVSILTDADLSELENVKVLVEPKIRIVNKRIRENLVMALSAFNERLYVSYPFVQIDGKKQTRSQVITYIEQIIGENNFKPFPKYFGYLTKTQGLKTFSKQVTEFAERELDDFSIATAYHSAVDNEIVKAILDRAGRQVKERLNGTYRDIVRNKISPTLIENYYSCPYRAFITYALSVKEKDVGQIDALSVGNIMHDILQEYVKVVDKVNDEDSSNRYFDGIKDSVLSNPVYSRFLNDEKTSAVVESVLRECKKYCYKTYESFKVSAFDKSITETHFGSQGDTFPAIQLNGGKVRITGKIDRVDYNDGYYRVLDYKTGKATAAETQLYAGVKMQLYLYAAAVDKVFSEQGKELAGMYYAPINDSFQKEEDKQKWLSIVKTNDNINALVNIDQNILENKESQIISAKVTKSGSLSNGSAMPLSEIKNLMEYAVMMCEQAVELLNGGYIKATPFGEKGCEYCKYKAFCDNVDGEYRKIESKKGGKDVTD